MTAAAPAATLQRVVVIGTGAMGGLFAAALADGGADVVVVDSDPAIVEAVAGDGLRVQRDGRECRYRLRTFRSGTPGTFADGGEADLVLVSTKGYDTDAAVIAAASWLAAGTVFATLQNGLGNADAIRARHPARRVAVGLTTETAEVVAPGVVAAMSSRPGETVIGGRDARERAVAAALAARLSAGGCPARLDPDIDRAIWLKLVVNCALNPSCAVGDATVGGLARTAGATVLLDAAAAEVAAVARSQGVALTDDAARAYLFKVADEAGGHRPSMADDLRRGRRTEIDRITGAVLSRADAAGVPVPTLRAFDVLLRLREAAGSSSRRGEGYGAGNDGRGPGTGARG